MFALGLNLNLILSLPSDERFLPLSLIPFFSLTVKRIAIPTTKKTRTERTPDWTFPWKSFYNKSQKD